MNSVKTALLLLSPLAIASCGQDHVREGYAGRAVVTHTDGETWAHYEDGSFEVTKNVTFQVTAPKAAEGTSLRYVLNLMAFNESEKLFVVGTEWDFPVDEENLTKDALDSSLYREILKKQDAKVKQQD